MGRHSLYTDELAEEIVERMSEGTPLAVICRDIGISDDAVRDWQKVRPEFEQAIACARKAGFDAIAAECMFIADDTSNDYATRQRPDGSEFKAFDADHVQRAKLRIDTRLKLLAKWDPKRYGEKLALVGGDEGDAPIQTVTRIAREIIDPKGE